MKAIGGLPIERTPLNLQCTGKIDCGNYTIEKILYQSQPNFYVTAVLYIPNGITSPQPTVMFVHGHADNAKAYPTYQKVCIDLVNNNFVVMAIDPPGQGERFQYFDPESGDRIIGGCTTEHTYAGLQFTLNGASIARHFIWDTIRGLDYLESLPEVDPLRIGLTGNSGGGTQSSFLMISEPRFAAAMPCTFIMTLESYMKTGQPQDSEQIVPGCFVHGPDHDEYITAIAPKPVRVGAVAYDFFPIEGAIEAVNRAKKVYALYNAESRLDMIISPHSHQYSPELRQACVNFFKQHFRGESPDFRTEDPEVLSNSDLWVTPNGQILDLYSDSKTVFDLNRERVSQIEIQLRGVTELRQSIEEVLGVVGDRDQPIYPRIISDQVIDGYRTEKIFFFSQPNIVVTGIMIHPKHDIEVIQTDLVIFEKGTNQIPDMRDWLEQRLADGHRIFVYDLRGIGAVEMRPVNRNNHPHSTAYKLASDAIMLGISTLGLRVFDVLRGYDYLHSRPDVAMVGLYGLQKGAVYAYFAGALEDRFASLEFEDLLISYRNLAETRYYDQEHYNLEIAAWGILQEFDLPDLLPCFNNRIFRVITSRNANGDMAPSMSN